MIKTILLTTVSLSAISWVAISLCVVLVVLLYGYMLRTRRRYRDADGCQASALVSAGDRKGVPGCVKCHSLAGKRFVDKDGSVMDAADYDHYTVVGDSMRYCGIRDGNVVFATKGANLADLKGMPVPVVLKWADPRPGEPACKLRRAWATWIPTGDYSDMLQAIFSNPKFQQIREIKGYDTDDALARDFAEVRLPAYLRRHAVGPEGGSVADVALISTTFNVGEGKVHFSIHPLSSLVGVVKASFDLGGK